MGWNPTRMDPNGNTWNSIANGIPLDSTVLFASTTLQYEDGKIADASNGVYNHHVAFISSSKSNPQLLGCPGQKPSLFKQPSTIMGASEEIGASSYTTPDGVFNSGYYIGKNERIMVTGEVVNYTNDTKKIYSVSDLEYIPGRPAGSLDVSVQVVSVNQCESSDISLHPPAGKKVYSFKSQNMTILQDGYIMSRREFSIISCLTLGHIFYISRLLTIPRWSSSRRWC